MTKLLVLPFILLLSSCLSISYPSAKISSSGKAINSDATEYELRKVLKIRNDLLNMNPAVSLRDATVISHMAVFYPQVLTNRYKLTSPPLLHNIMVNTGRRPRGLCINWTEDLIKRSLELDPSTLDIYWAVSNRGNMLREHSTLLVTARGMPLLSGYIIDPWRNSGNVYWKKATQDPKYKWEDLGVKDYNKNRHLARK